MQLTGVNRELTALQTLPPHANIVQLCHVHRDSEYAYLFLTSPRGAVTLRNYLDEHVTRGSQLTEHSVRLIMRQLLDAVHHCHTRQVSIPICCSARTDHCLIRGVAHRDLKLENVLIVPHSLHVTLIDFGLALTDHVTHVHEALGSVLHTSHYPYPPYYYPYPPLTPLDADHRCTWPLNCSVHVLTVRAVRTCGPSVWWHSTYIYLRRHFNIDTTHTYNIHI